MDVGRGQRGLAVIAGPAGASPDVAPLGDQQRLDVLGADVGQHVPTAGMVVQQTLEGRLPLSLLSLLSSLSLPSGHRR